ncbi:MAG TPA: type I 3-dehydroquinate dehydratase, partial [Pirellulales bacterium]
MICVSIARGKVRDLLAEHQRLVAQGVELVEWRLDWLREPIDLTKMLKERPGPVIVTCRLPQDFGKWDGNEAERLGLLRSAIVAGADYVDLEEDAARAIGRYGTTKRIVSMHDIKRTPDDLDAIHARLAACDADIVKIATTARRPQDCLRVLELTNRSTIPTIGLCMGDVGLPTRLLANKFGSF